MKNSYVLFVKTGFEERIVRLLKKRLVSSLFSPYVLTKETLFRKKGETIKSVEIYFRGYVFIDSELGTEDFVFEISPYIMKIEGIYQIVNYGNKSDIVISERERTMLKNLFGINHCIGSSKGLIVGDRIKINEGPLIGFENIIKKINRHKRQAVIEIDMLGEVRQLTVSLEIVEKIPIG
ncbi:antiterminator LoaP [Lacrimispora brassicae]